MKTTLDVIDQRTTRLARDWKEYAQESVTVEQIGGAFYGFGSEMACLRIYHKYRGATRTEAK
jgi:hypothetical protein